jgi:hypothetical protein
MKNKKSIWIPAILFAAVAAGLLIYYFFFASSGEGPRRPPEGMQRPPEGFRKEEGGAGDWFTTLGTIAVFLGAAAFSWFWFKKKLRSSSIWVRRVGKLLHTLHKPLGWSVLLLIAIHGIYFLINKLHDEKIFSGLAAFTILLGLAVYGMMINKVRNKWTRLVHRSLGLLWVPALIIHAGGSAIAAVVANIGVWVLIRLFERYDTSGSKAVARA